MTTTPEYAKGENTSAPAPDSGEELQPYHIDGVPLPMPKNKDFEPEYICKWITKRDIDSKLKRQKRP